MSDVKEEKSIKWAAHDLQEKIQDLKDLVGDDDPELLADTLEGETTFFDVVDSALEIIQNDQAIIEGLKALIDKFDTRKRRKMERVKRIRAFLEMFIDGAGLAKVERAGATLSIADLPILPIVEDEEKLPSKYWKTPPPVIDKAAIKRAYSERNTAMMEARSIGDPLERKAAIEKVNETMPAIAGVGETNGGITLKIRTA